MECGGINFTRSRIINIRKMLRFISKQQCYLKSFLAIKNLPFLKLNQNIYFKKALKNTIQKIVFD